VLLQNLSPNQDSCLLLLSKFLRRLFFRRGDDGASRILSVESCFFLGDCGLSALLQIGTMSNGEVVILMAVGFPEKKTGFDVECLVIRGQVKSDEYTTTAETSSVIVEGLKKRTSTVKPSDSAANCYCPVPRSGKKFCKRNFVTVALGCLCMKDVLLLDGFEHSSVVRLYSVYCVRQA